MPNLTSVTVTSGVPTAGTGTVSTIDALMADGGQVTLGAKADAKSTATDTTAVSGISIWKQISFSAQAIAASVAATLATKEVRSATGTQSIVASSATDVTILASNANRLGAAIYNDSTQILYLLVGAGTSSATVFTVAMATASYFEVPACYTGIIKGLWASANGSARVTEYS